MVGMLSVAEENSLEYHAENPYRRGTILIVSPAADFSEALKYCLGRDNEQFHNNMLQYEYCENIEFDMLSSPDVNNFSPDFIVIVIDPRNSSCILVAEEAIRKIEKKYIAAGRVCLVNGACSLKPSQMAIGYGHINVMSQTYSAILINGDLLIPDKCQILATRISKIASTVCGFSSGIPVSIDVPGYEEEFN